MQNEGPARAVRERMIDGYRVVYDAETARRMGGVRQKDTGAEMAVRRALTLLGLRYRVRNRDLAGSPDVANRAAGWAVFVHGCYWHRHQGCPRATTPKRNIDFWVSKFEANVTRDRKVYARLRREGFEVLTVWECQTERTGKMLALLSRFTRNLRGNVATRKAMRHTGDRIEHLAGHGVGRQHRFGSGMALPRTVLRSK
jgi:DNA mismatch endonuclease (patch repair protein)